MSPSLAERLADLAGAGSSEAILALAEAIGNGRVRPDASAVGFQRVRGIDGDLAAAAYGALRDVEDPDPDVIATALKSAVLVRMGERLDRPEVQVAWTGPEAEGATVVSTRHVVERLLSDVRDSGTILLVGYSISVADGSWMAAIRDRLESISREKKALITIVTDEQWDADNRHKLLDGWDVFARKPRMYTWAPPDPEYPYTKMHAKCLVVDRLQMLVGSANFTQGGLDGNLELGLLVRNQPLASAVHDRFQTLINTKVLKEMAA